MEARRDFIGYGRNPPLPNWPNDARVAVSFVLNYEEGAESNVLDGDAQSETFLSEIIGAAPFPDRHMSMESLYEYGSRAGAWRVLRLFEQYQLPLTVFGVALALARNPEITAAFVAAKHEIVSHGYRWISYQGADEKLEASHIAQAVDVITELTGAAPKGWYTGRDSPRTRALLVRQGGFLYDNDSYADDLPYWVDVDDKQHLVIPYTLDTNDMRFMTPQGFNTGDHFSRYCTDAFDALYKEGKESPKMLTIGLHGRIIGRPARIGGLERLIDHILGHESVWIAQRVEIANHWRALHPPL